MIIDHRYEVLESIGSGAWSNVYKVVDKRSGQIFTLKLFQYLSSKELYEKFTAEEMHHITKIEHPNLGHIIDFGHVGDHIYSLSEYYDGSPLKNLRFKKSNLELFYDIIVQITYALEALHVQDILHKDLKPENVLFKIEGNRINIKVIDYGFSKIESTKDQQNVTGSLPYLAPEVYLNKPLSKSCDYYSLGVLLYKLTTGTFPFSVEQINALITDSYHYFIPKFPTELNPDIPPALEKFILRLLEKNPESRFQSADEIIKYVNRIQIKQYPFSIEWSMVNRMKFNSYLTRESYSHQLIDYLESIDNQNGKIISLIGSEGMGKDSVLSLFRYHLLTGRCFLFDYTCSRKDHEPFFALIKEFMQSIDKKEIAKLESLANISTKFNLYLFQSAQEAKKVSQNQDELLADFESVKNILTKLSEQKPLIFIIRNAQHAHKYTIDFLNYISSFITDNKMLIVMGFDNYNKVAQIAHTIIIQIPPLTYKETNDYIGRLLNSTAKEEFVHKVWEISAGNPLFVRDILIDLVQKKHIVKDNNFWLDYSFEEYNLPLKIYQSIIGRLSHVTQKHYKYLQLLAIVEPPMEKGLIKYVLNIDDEGLYELINDSLFNDVLAKKDRLYSFVYKEAKDKLKSENEKSILEKVSNTIIKYFSQIEVKEIDICKGIIENSIIALDDQTQRHYSFRLYELYNEMHDQDNAYHSILDVLNIDFNNNISVLKIQLITDLILFQEKTELTGLCLCSKEVINSLKKIPDIFEKYYVLGTIYYIKEDMKSALKSFEKASELIVTGKQRISIWLYYLQLYSQTDLNKMYEVLQLLSMENLPLDLRIVYFDRLSIFYKLKGQMLKAIQISEDLVSELPSIQDTNVLLRLASLHNNLGVCYSTIKNIDEAKEHFNIALAIWKRFNVKRYLGLIYNNFSDLYLKQGITPTSISFSQKGYEIASGQGLTSTMALALLNMGEACIKMGEFRKAEEYLLKAKRLMDQIKSKKYLTAIIMNLALAKSKIYNFKYYHDFIIETEPNLQEGIITEINPLVKTYFYYLFELGLAKKLNKLLRKNAHIDYHEIHEDEFYYNTLSLNAILNQDFKLVMDHLKNAEKYAGEVNNHYAMTVFYLSEIECYIGLNENEKATELISKAMDLAVTYNYQYWIAKLQYFKARVELSDANIPLRKVLRDLLDLYQQSSSSEYYLIKVKTSYLIIQILYALDSDIEAQEWIKDHKILLEFVTDGIDREDKELYLKTNGYYVIDNESIEERIIASRYKNIKQKWQELQYNLLIVRDAERIKFFIDKGLREIIAPWSYQILLFSEELNSYSRYIADNVHDSFALSSDFYQIIEKSFKTDNIVTKHHNSFNNMIIPLQIRYHKIGFLIISDHNEAKFSKFEISLMKSIKQHLTSLLIRMQDYSEITKRIDMMNRLMKVSHSLLRMIDTKTLENEIISACIDFTGASRGFLIKKDSGGNNVYQVAIDSFKAPISNVAVLSKSVLSYCQNNKTTISTYNAVEDNRFRKSISVQDYKLHSIFCAPLIVNDNIYGFVYLDNYLDNTKSMYLNEEIITLLFDQLSIALKNSLQYESLIRKSQEMQSLEYLKDEFMAIVSHELNTPLSTLQGYVSRLKRNLFADEDERNEIISRIESSVKKLILTTNDIVTMNNYNLKNHLPKVPIKINEVLKLIYHEIEIVSRNRKMIIKLENPSDLPDIEGNWEALHLMIYNVVLNAIRFTNDFGTINIGARISTFQDEKIDNKESLVIYVQDNGIGMPAYQIKNIFRKFYELNEIYAHKSGTIEYRSSGLGLGLATSKRIAELHFGNIWIESKENEGTTVFIRLPIKPEK